MFAAQPPVVGKPDVLPHVLLALTVVLITCRLLGALFRHLRQPPVIGEVVGGILLGPSLLGWLWPDAANFLLPAEVAPFLSVLAQLGVIFFMFLVGLELNPAVLRAQAAASLVIAQTSIVVPFLCGALFAYVMYAQLASAEVALTSFALFMGVAMAITAFPVLARILTDMGLQRTRLGTLALTCAAVDDATAWCLLAIVVGIAQAQVGAALLILGGTLVYVGVMVGVVRPLAVRYVHGLEPAHITPGVIAAVLAALLLSSLATEALGLHAIFGAFLLGAIIPHESALAQSLKHKLEDLVTILLLPTFFAFTGMRTEIGLVAGVYEWTLTAIIILIATLGKFGGAYVAARLVGYEARQAAAIGVLMNTRGLMELIVLNVGLDLHIISPTLFAMMVLMALATTLATTPLLHLLSVRAWALEPPARASDKLH